MPTRTISISCLGNFGRFGNSLLQYCFARAYAEKNNAVLETPPWIGEKVFDISINRISKKLPQTKCDIVPWGKVNIDLLGTFQHTEFLSILTREKVRKYLKIKDKWISKFSKPKDFYITAHLRRDDYVNQFSNIYCVIPEKSYSMAIRKYGYNEEDVIWVSDDKTLNTNPVKTINEDGLEFLNDFLLMMNSDVLFRANSTFSWWAGVLGNPKVYSPVVNRMTGRQNVNFSEGNDQAFFDTNNLPKRVRKIHNYKHSKMILGDK